MAHLDEKRIEILDETMVALLRTKAGVERLQMAFGMWRTAKLIVTAGVRDQHPEWTAGQVQREVARRMSHGAA
jgi:hypothetical protein